MNTNVGDLRRLHFFLLVTEIVFKGRDAPSSDCDGSIHLPIVAFVHCELAMGFFL